MSEAANANEMISRTIDLICADPGLSDAFKRGLRMAEEIRREQEAFHNRLLYLSTLTHHPM
jgi:hypothetical protein